jgi:hypothetical protein
MALRFWSGRPDAAAPAGAPGTAPPPAPPPRAGALAPFRAVGRWLADAFGALDRAFCAIAVVFGTTVRNPWQRYAIMAGVFTFIYVLGALHLGAVSLAALVFGYVGILAIGRAWVVNEKQRTAIAKKLADGEPEKMPDLRGAALFAALQLFILFPLLFRQAQLQYHLFAVAGETSFGDWVWFAVDKTYLKALPDWSVLYGVHISSIGFEAPGSRHLVMLARLTFDYILIQGIFRLLAIRATVNEAVAAVKADPELAVRLGRRAVKPLIAKLSDPDKAVRGAAANALTQLGEADALRQLGTGA